MVAITFNLKNVLALLSLTILAKGKDEALPPTGGSYLIQNAQSGLVLALSSAGGPATLGSPGNPVVEFPLSEPVASTGGQIWQFSPELGNVGVLRASDPPTFLNCPNLTEAAVCSGNENTISPVGIFAAPSGGFVIEPASGLSITGTGNTLGQVFLSPTTGALDQVWVFLTVPSS